MQNLKVGLVQMDIVWENTPANIEKIDGFLNGMTDLDLIILPEMFNTGFSMDPARIAEGEDGNAVSWMRNTSAELQTTIIGSVAIVENGKYYNRCFVASQGDIIARYDKHNLFTMAGEEKVYTRGTKNISFELKGWKIKPLVCYDLRFPTWCYNKEEADLLIFPANWPAKRISHWSALLKARAIENQAFVIGVNRVGADGTGKAHNGYSTVVNPMGELIAEHINESGLFIYEINRTEVDDFKALFNVLQDHRVIE